MKRLALALLVCAACKADKKPDPTPSADLAPATRHATSRTPPPSLPPPNEEEGSDRPALADDGDDGSGRHHHHHRGWGDGSGSAMTPEEREARFAEHISHMRDRFDTDGDGKVSYDELKNAPGRMHFDNPEEIDTNHDGDISTDELLAAMKARREAWRAQRDAQGGAGGPPPADNGSN